jgi:hypothetical protein
MAASRSLLDPGEDNPRAAGILPGREEATADRVGP